MSQQPSAPIIDSSAYVPENVRLYDSLTAAENLGFFAPLSGVSDVSKRIDDALGFRIVRLNAELGITIFMNTHLASFSAMIPSLARQPEMREELTQVQRLGFALTEACFFYGLVAALIAFFPIVGRLIGASSGRSTLPP